LNTKSCPYTHEQYGVAEQKHHHILETSCALLISSSIPHNFWAKAVLTSANLINIASSPILADKTPHKRLYYPPPEYSRLHTCLGVPAMSFLRSSTPSYLPNQLSASYSTSVLSIRIITAMIPWHVNFLSLVMSPSLRYSPYFLLHLRMFTFCHHLMHHMLSLLEFLSIWSLRLFLNLIILDNLCCYYTVPDSRPRGSTSYYHSTTTTCSLSLTAPPQAIYPSYPWLYWPS